MAVKKEQAKVKIEVCGMGENVSRKRVFFVLETDTQKCPDAHEAYKRIMYDHEPGKADGSVRSFGLYTSAYLNRSTKDDTEYEEVKEMGADGSMHTVLDEFGKPQMKQRGWGMPIGYQGIFAVVTVEQGRGFTVDNGIADVKPFISPSDKPTLRWLRTDEQKIAYLQACAERMAGVMSQRLSEVEEEKAKKTGKKADTVKVVIPSDDSIFHLAGFEFVFDRHIGINNEVGSYEPHVELVPAIVEEYFTAERVDVLQDIPEGFTVLHALRNFLDPVIMANKDKDPHYYGNEARRKGDYFPCQNIVVKMLTDKDYAEVANPSECTRWNLMHKTAIYTPDSRTPALDALRDYLNGLDK